MSPALPGCRGGAPKGAPIHPPPIGTWGLEHQMSVDLVHTPSGTPISARISGRGKGASAVPEVCYPGFPRLGPLTDPYHEGF